MQVDLIKTLMLIFIKPQKTLIDQDDSPGATLGIDLIVQVKTLNANREQSSCEQIAVRAEANDKPKDMN